MGTLIKYRRFDQFIQEYEEALQEIMNLMLGDDSATEKIDAAYFNDTFSQFNREFKQVVASNLEHPLLLENYIKEIYYKLGYLLVRFRKVQAKRFLQLNDDWLKAADDNLFLTITNGYVGSIDNILSLIQAEANKHSINDLKYISNLSIADYNISGEYIYLEKNKLNKIQQTKTVIPQAVYALYYYYLHTTGYLPQFEKHEKGKMKAIEEVANKIGNSAKAFQLAYNKIAHFQANRISPSQIHNLKQVILMLKDYPKAQELAKDELKVAELKS
jgi:hypothetical protein